MGPPMSEPLLADLQAAIAAEDDAAAEAIIPQLSPAAEPRLLQWLATGTPDERWWAIRALAAWGGPAAVPALRQALTDSEAVIRGLAAMALGHLFQRQAELVAPILPDVAARLADEAGSVRQATADALAQCGDAALPVLATVLAGEHQGARTRAAYALRKMATRTSAALLFQHLNDSNYLVHTLIHETLDDLGLLENLLLAP